MRRARKLDDESGVDLTPMLDIVFIMLIFFIVTATFVQEQGIDVLRPDNDEQQQQANVPPIVIFVSAENRVQIGERFVDIRAVRANVERARVENPRSAVIIQAAEEADMGVTILVMDQARLAGAPAVSIATVEG